MCKDDLFLDNTYYNGIDGSKVSMFDSFHRCLFCNSIAAILDSFRYSCTKCGFIWEVLDCD